MDFEAKDIRKSVLNLVVRQISKDVIDSGLATGRLLIFMPVCTQG